MKNQGNIIGFPVEADCRELLYVKTLYLCESYPFGQKDELISHMHSSFIYRTEKCIISTELLRTYSYN